MAHGEKEPVKTCMSMQASTYEIRNMEKDASNGRVVIDMLVNIIMINGKAEAP